MSSARERFRSLLVRPQCTIAANIFDPLSARIAHMLDYEVCFLSGSVGKVANLGIPDIVLGNLSDLVDHCRRITRIADVSLMIDGEDAVARLEAVLPVRCPHGSERRWSGRRTGLSASLRAPPQP